VAVNGLGTVATVSGDTLRLSGSGTTGAAQVIVSASDGVNTAYDTFTVTTTGSTGIDPRPAASVNLELAVGLPHVFASQVTGSGAGLLGTEVAGDEAHSLTVDLLLPAAGTISVQIFDQLGTPVIALSRSVDATELAGLVPTHDGRRILPVSWNLRAANGVAAAPGVYLWQIEVNTVDGQVLKAIKRLGVKAPGGGRSQ
jgi:hypothetical protein